MFLENEPIKYKVMIQTIIFCGLRLGELTALEWTDIDFGEETISVSKQLQHMPGLGTYEMDSTKSESGNRTISMPARLVNLLKEYKAWQDEEKIKRENKWIESHKLFTKENGELIHPDTPSKWFTKFIKRTNLPKLTFHQLRRTNAALLISMGVDAAAVSKRLGHSKISTTADIYGHALKRYDKEAADKLGSLIK
jgi:integrase